MKTIILNSSLGNSDAKKMDYKLSERATSFCIMENPEYYMNADDGTEYTFVAYSANGEIVEQFGGYACRDYKNVSDFISNHASDSDRFFTKKEITKREYLAYRRRYFKYFKLRMDADRAEKEIEVIKSGFRIYDFLYAKPRKKTDREKLKEAKEVFDLLRDEYQGLVPKARHPKYYNIIFDRK
jgi:hypothetical protein